MKKFTLISLSVFLSISFVFMGCSSDSASMKVTPDSHNFGDVQLGATVSQDLVIKNKYDYSVKITSIMLSNTTDFSINVVLPIDLDENEEYTLKVDCHPKTLGLCDATLSITHTGSNEAVKVSLSCNGKESAIFKIWTHNLDFGSKAVLSQTVTGFDIKNTGTIDLEISKIQITGTGSAAYSFVVGGTTPIVISPGSNHLLNLKFMPPFASIYDAKVEFYHNAANESSPSIMNVTGEGY